MDRRYRLMSEFGVRNIAGFNEKVKDGIASGKPLRNPFSTNPPPSPIAVLKIKREFDACLKSNPPYNSWVYSNTIGMGALYLALTCQLDPFKLVFESTAASDPAYDP